jgi:hypothetical protein
MTALISALALAVSVLSLGLSVYSVWRVRKKETPHAWAGVEKTNTPRLYVVTVKLRNPTQYVFKFAAMSVPLNRIPVDEKQDFLLVQRDAFRGHSEEWAKENIDKVARGMKLEISGEIPSGEIGSVKMLLIRGSLSAAQEAKITVGYWSMENKPRYRNQVVKATLPTSGLTISVFAV